MNTNGTGREGGFAERDRGSFEFDNPYPDRLYGHKDPIQQFTGEYKYLSNMEQLKNPFRVLLGGEVVVVPTSEHVYQMAKFSDLDIQKRIANLPTGHQAKAEVRRIVKNRPELLDVGSWARKKDEVMHEVVKRKFFANPELAEKLLETEDAEIEEGNGWGDRYWGVSPPIIGAGLNKLGKILMKVREELHHADERTMQEIGGSIIDLAMFNEDERE